MGSLGDDDGKAAQFTEPFDSQLSPSSSHGQQDVAGDDDEREFLESTMPLYENTPVEDALETQEVNFADETEVLNIAGETQVLNDIDGIDDINTQLWDEIDGGFPIASDGEGTDGTEILENIDELCTDDPQCKDSAQSADSKKIQCEPFGRHGEKKVWEQTDAITDEQTSSGKLPPRFTYLRVETLRESALAIRNMALKKNNGETKSITSISQSLEPLIVKDDRESFLVGSVKGRKFDHGKQSEEMDESGNKNKCKVTSSAVRKLFDDDSSIENTRPSLNSNNIYGEGLANLPICDNELAGLSYVNSQEPGELSQANALDFIDRFLQDNLIEFDQQANHGKNMQEKSKSLPSTKGQQSLAKKASNNGKAVKAGIFDWDDSREDECGGDILIRRREDIFGSESCRQKSCPQNIKGSRVKVGEKQLSIPNKRMSAVHSDSRIVLHSLNARDNTAQETSTKTRRKLVNELEANVGSSGRQTEPNGTAAAGLEVLGVGCDTQMAAEAMEELCNGEGIASHDANDATHITKSSLIDQHNNLSAQKTMEITSKKQLGKFDGKMKKKCNKETGLLCEGDARMKRSKRSKLKLDDYLTSTSENDSEMPSLISKKRKSAGASKRHPTKKLNNCTVNESRSGRKLVDKRQIQGGVSDFTPVSYRTRQSSALNQSKKPEGLPRKFREEDGDVVSLEKRNCGTGIQVLKALDPKPAMVCSDDYGVDANTKFPSKLNCDNNGTKIDMVDYPRRRRSLRKSSQCDKGFEKLGCPVKESAESEEIVKSTVQKRKMKTDARNVTRSNVNFHSISSIDLNKGKTSQLILDNPNACDTSSANIKSGRKNGADFLLSAKSMGDTRLDESPSKRFKSSGLTSVTPAGCKTPANDVSPVCMGDDYYKQSCNRNLSTSCLVKVPHRELSRELRSLSATGSEPNTPSRKRRDMNDVLILYSNHLDEDIVKHQKKILARLGASVASSITDATHFIADQFVRTRNMLEAIASGKPVVTHLWIESCGQASCFIDEKNFILRDSKKEKEIGFSMPVSLARASQHPLLEGRRVFITPNAKPSKEIISSLVKAVQGQAVERIGRSALKDDKIPDNLLVLTCEEDYATCVPFLEKGAAVHSSELLLNGIVTQKLEYERLDCLSHAICPPGKEIMYVLFADNVKKTRSTIWLKRDGKTFLPVTKCK
ncbi:hypothetical protein L6164_012616 [Bauhinia variegata]|uniref:Uncharacterized protein n=1 Tax=Bauhinia variegata TaxID=167791 RepID=A0ACB9PFT9_BAUVA|nr:hypothetical protein L6164_012616 [Bauhinia variegata]